ncbi:MAG: flavodoxin family protein [Clostridiales bacterium]|jgi:multimeric flavodoxin WrbA|nr:flavodoxin family protein [Clostridiales bacterium]
MFLIISGNPKTDGLCHSVTEAVQRGAAEAGENVQTLTVAALERCHVCGNGWGKCLTEHACAFGGDGYDEAVEFVRKADKICIITPVYWGEMAEGLKSFFDRLRRCENVIRGSGALAGKPVLLIASPGGSGNGALSCLEQMERFCRHTGAVIFDYISVNRWNQDYKRESAYAAAKAIAGGRKAGETLQTE